MNTTKEKGWLAINNRLWFVAGVRLSLARPQCR